MKNEIENLPKFSFCVEVSAAFAEFTNKKDQRISYPVPTSGAIRGFLQSIFWKPAIKYIPRSVEVLNPIRRMDVKKNEMRSGDKPVGGDNRVQKNTSYLRDVRYRIHADLVYLPKEYRLMFFKNYEFRDDGGETPEKYYNTIKRRVTHGQCGHSPYLGTRECVCSKIEWVDENSPSVKPIDETRDLGMMYVDYIYNEDYTIRNRERMARLISSETSKKPKKDAEFSPRAVSGRVRMENGVVKYPSKYELLEDMLDSMESFWGK